MGAAKGFEPSLRHGRASLHDGDYSLLARYADYLITGRAGAAWGGKHLRQLLRTLRRKRLPQLWNFPQHRRLMSGRL